jgi:ABC-type multidrug transport system ATPase subunit
LIFFKGYIQQEDVFVAAMTVKEHLIFHARLRVARLSRKDMMERVNRLVRMMGLGHCIHTLIGKAGLTKV